MPCRPVSAARDERLSQGGAHGAAGSTPPLGMHDLRKVAVPLYEYACTDCANEFERLQRRTRLSR
jgi:hypothetical protein